MSKNPELGGERLPAAVARGLWGFATMHGAVVSAVAALLLTFTLLLLAIFGIAKPGREELEKRCEAALDRSEFSEAVIWAKRALREAPSNMKMRMRLAEIYAGTGALDSLVEVMSEIAPFERPVYGPAHLLRARVIWSGRPLAPVSAEAMKLSLELALEAKPSASGDAVDPDDVRALQAELAASQGDWKHVCSASMAMKRVDPGTLLLRASALKNLGRASEAMEAADQAVAETLQTRNGNTLDDRLRRAAVQSTAWMVKGDYRKAMEVLEDETLEPGEPRVRELSVGVLGKVAAGCRSAPDKDSALWMESISRGLEIAPDDLELTGELIAGYGAWAFLPGFKERFAKRFSEGGLKGLGALLAGMEKLQAGDLGAALEQFEAGHACLPDNAVLSNNLAGVLGIRPVSADCKRALGIMDGVLKNHPGHPEFLDTKGRVLMRLGRYADAIRVLEAALTERRSPSTHLVTAEAYAKLGAQHKAEEHRKAAMRKTR